MKRMIIMTALFLGLFGTASAAPIFSATTGNTRLFNNGSNDDGLLTLTGATPDLVLNNANGGFNNGGFSSTDSIGTLLGTALTSTNAVSMSVTVDSIGGTGELRSNGIQFGMAGAAVFGGGTPFFILGIEASSSGSDVTLASSFVTGGDAGFNVVQSSLEDGFSITLTADVSGYRFLLTDIVTDGGATSASVEGSFSGTEFVDNFNGGRFYISAQKYNNGNIELDFSEATISVGEYIEVIEPSLPPEPPVMEVEGKVVFEAATNNTVLVGNTTGGSVAGLTLTGATPDLLFYNANGNFNNSGFVGVESINTLNQGVLTSNHEVVMKETVDSITGASLRANGLSFGLAGAQAFGGGGTGTLLLGIEAANNGSDVFISSSFLAGGLAGFDVTESSLYDGFSITLTANQSGYTFLLEDIIVTGSGATSATVSGSFAGTEFVDYFGAGYLYTAAQKYDDGNMTVDYSEASIVIFDKSARQHLFLADFDASTEISGSVEANATAANLDAGTSVGSWYLPYREPGAIVSDGGANNAFVFDQEVSVYSDNTVYAVFDRSVDLMDGADLVVEMDLYAARQNSSKLVEFSLDDAAGNSAYTFVFGMPNTKEFYSVNSSGQETGLTANGTGVNNGYKNPAVDGYQSWGATMIHVKAEITGQPTQAGNRGATLSIDWNGDGDYDDAGELVEAHVGPRTSGITKISSLRISNPVNGGAWIDNLSVTAGWGPMVFSDDHIDLAKFQANGKDSQVSSDIYAYATDGMIARDSRWLSSSTSDHWVSLKLAAPMTIGSAHLFSGGAANPAMEDVRLQYHNGSAWKLISGASFAGNTSIDLNMTFDAPITAQQFRLYTGDATARVRELALYPPTSDGSMVKFGADLDLNIGKLRQYTYSSVSGANYPKLAIDGHAHNTSGWKSANTAEPHELAIYLPRGDKVGSVHVYSGYEGQPGTQIENFQLSYKNDAGWINFDGGTVTGNTELDRIVHLDTPQYVTAVRIQALDGKQAFIREFVVLPHNGAGGYPLGTDAKNEAPSTKSFLDYDDSYYTFENRSAGLNLTSSTSGTMLTADEDPWFQVLLNIGTETYRLRSKESEKCFEVAQGSTNAGAAIVEGTYNSMPHQRWFLEDTGDGTHFQIVNAWSGMALDVDGDQVVQQPLSTDQSQHWKVNYEKHYRKRGQAANIHFNPLFKPSWHYDWRITPKSPLTYGQHMPMQWGGMSSSTVEILKYQSTWYSRANQTTVLGFNEPDKEDQSNISEVNAAYRWPRFERMRLPLLGPVPAQWNGTWRKAYEAMADERGFRCEYTAMHWYAECNQGNPGNIIGCVNTLYKTYGKPVWITEFAVKNWGSADGKWDRKDNYNWLAEFLWRSEKVEGLAKFSMFEFGNGDSSADIQENNSPTMALHIRNDSTNPGFEDLSEIGLLMAGWDGDDTIRDSKPYIIHNRLGMRLIDDPAASTIGSANILNRTQTEQFELRPGPSGKKYIVGLSSGRRLSCDGTTVSLAASGTTGAAVEWTLTNISYGWVRLDHSATSKRLVIYDTGVVALTSTANAWDSTKFRFINPWEPMGTITKQTIPYEESFETGFGVWAQSDEDDFEWSIGSGYTTTSNTGPSSASDGTQYLFLEQHDSSVQYKTAQIDCLFDLSTVDAADLIFDYHMYGVNIDYLALDVHDGTSWTSNVWIRSGSQQTSSEDAWLTAVVDLGDFAGKSDVMLRFRGKQKQWHVADMAIDNIRVLPAPESLPYFEGFESGFGAWDQAWDDDFDWSIGSGETESNTAGPSGASEGVQYLFAEGHDGGQYALAAVECSFDLSTLTSVGMTFDYHMCGNNIDYVSLDVHDGTTWTYNVWKRTGPQQAASTDPWLTADVDLSAFAGNQRVKLRFNYKKAQWAYGDPAIDNIHIMSVANVPPVADSTSVILGADRTVSITLTGSDANGDPLTYDVVSPDHGTLDGTAPNLVYTAGAGYTDLDHFTFTVNDGEFDSAEATVSIIDQDVLQIITPAGSGSGYDAASAEAAAFRSTGIAKGFDTDGDDAYGTLGTFFYGNGANNTSNSDDKPSGVTAVGSAGVSLVASADYTDFDNPTLTIADTVANWTTTTIGLVNTGTANAWAELMTFAVDATAPRRFRLGVMAGNEWTADGRWNPAALRVSFAGGTAAEVSGLGTTLGMVFFDVTLPDNVSGTFSIEGQTRSLGSNTKGPSIAGITFDMGSDPYAQWAGTVFIFAPEGTDQSDSGNPDGDRFNNRQEWALNTDPLTADKPAMDTSISDDNFVALYERRDPAVTGIDVYASWATSLFAETWRIHEDGMTETSNGWSNDVETVLVELSLDHTNAFIRIQTEER